MNFLSHFPLETPRKTQIEVLGLIEKAYKDGFKNVLLEAPVGTGKSAIALSVAQGFRDAHILTPMKSLQDQYYNDFSSTGLVLMKGRNAYECERSPFVTCAEGPCLTSITAKSSCNEERVCPYVRATEAAQDSNLVVHNLHSFIFQGYFAKRFQVRDILVVDECHKIEEVIRGFASKKVLLPIHIKEEEAPTKEDNPRLEDWTEWFKGYSSLFRDTKDSIGTSPRDRFISTLAMLAELSDKIGRDYVVSFTSNPFSKTSIFEFTPVQIRDLANKLLLDFGKKRLFMSGTVYNKEVFCKTLGIQEEETRFIRIGSEFPKANRPIYMKSKYLVDTSHKSWDKSYPKIVDNILEVSSVFSDAKGLIHTPSYESSETLYRTLTFRGSDRFVKHDRGNFSEVLREFFNTKEPKILLSPICQQGVDFKYDRAKFQIILRVPFLNTSDVFVKEMVENNFPWYNHQALVTFGQQIGRVNRAPDDFGATILLDERFPNFVERNKGVLPKWLLEAIRR